MKRIITPVFVTFGLFAAFAAPAAALAQPAGYEFYGSFPDYATASRIARLISQGNDNRYDAGWAESSPDPVTRSYGVYARPRRFEPSPAPLPVVGPPASYVQHGQLTLGHSMDRFRTNSRAAVHTIHMNAGQRYVIDLTSPSGPNFFDVWLRVEDSRGAVLANNDDGGEGLNARMSFTAPYTGTFRLVVTSYRANATGSYTLAVR